MADVTGLRTVTFREPFFSLLANCFFLTAFFAAREQFF